MRRLRRREADKLPTRQQDFGFHRETIVVGNPDRPVLRRERALRQQIGHGLQGYSGQVRGYDRGDPAHSLTALVNAGPHPTAALAAIAPAKLRDAATLDPAEYSDRALTNPDLDPYMAALWNRLNR